MRRCAVPSVLGRGSYGHARRPDLRCAHVLYRLTCDECEAMRDRAQDRCELCGIPDHETPRGQLVIDHFEAQRVAFFVRGLLCDRCNSVMQRHDGSAPWGPASRPFAEKARAYHLNAFSQPGDEKFRLADEAIRRRVERRERLKPIRRRRTAELGTDRDSES
ncbi:endonuclease domain-containing protein [Streptomyces sp. TE5632]